MTRTLSPLDPQRRIAIRAMLVDQVAADLSATGQTAVRSHWAADRRLRLVAATAVILVAVAVTVAVDWSQPTPAAAVTKNDDGTITVAYFTHPNVETLDRELRATGAPVMALLWNDLPLCPSEAQRGPNDRPASWSRSRDGAMMASGDTIPVLRWTDLKDFTFDPKVIPGGKVGVVLMSGPGPDADGKNPWTTFPQLAPAPGPTCVPVHPSLAEFQRSRPRSPR
jgi:hypothetical protein